jgi:hypothetical protein
MVAGLDPDADIYKNARKYAANYADKVLNISGTVHGLFLLFRKTLTVMGMLLASVS